MDIIISEDYKEQCGNIFLTVNGNLVIHCTLCGKKFYGFRDYADHIRDDHEQSNKEDIQTYEFALDHMQNFSPPTNEATETFTLISEDDLKMFDDLEFHAPEPECREIEEYIVSLNNGEPNVELKEIRIVPSKQKSNQMQTTSKTTKSKHQTRNVTYKCPHCAFTSHACSSINQHVRRHTSAKQIQCTLCAKMFFMNSELKVHMRYHTKERPYLCDDCGKAFHTCSAFSRHQKKCRNIRDIECTRCGKKFFSVTDLRNHMTSHSNDRPFHCEICNASFKLVKALKNHVKIHENKHEYKCRLCPRSFNQAPGLFAHLKSHSIAHSISVSVTKTS